MNVSQFLKVVSEMREAQKAYFKNRLRGDLVRSKELEAMVDKALKEGIVFDLDIVDEWKEPTPEQGQMFE